MQTVIPSGVLPDSENARANELFAQSQNQTHRRTDRVFAWLMAFQWLAGVAAALWISPRTWIGASHQTHIHVWAAIFLGGAISGFPILLAWKYPGETITRQTFAVAQMLTSALLIHLTGGRIETHFHVFGSLAFLAFYRDWRVIVTATVVVAVDHMLRGLFWPQSVFGVLAASQWRWLEHAGWVVFEDTILFISIRQSVSEMRDMAARRANLEDVNTHLEEQKTALQREINERIQAQVKLEQTHKELVRVSRQAGMAEVASGVLHNVGNVLNSISVSASVVCDRLRKSEVADVHRAAAMLHGENGRLGEFLTADPRGKLIPEYLAKASELLAAERDELMHEMKAVGEHIEHIKEIVSMQQTYAKVFGVLEPVTLVSLVQDAIRMNAAAFDRHGVNVVQQIEENVPVAMVDRHKVLQILINLMRNSKYAMDEQAPSEKRLEILVRKTESGNPAIIVRDNGVGIAAENLERIFGHGFTTKKNGHGFGLHSGALAAKEMNGCLSVRSDGLGKGAEFTLELPPAPPADAARRGEISALAAQNN